MKIERISDSQIRCTLSNFDLSERNLNLSELAYGTEKARRLFREMVQKAYDEVGFDAEDIPLMKVLANIRDKEECKECSINFKKCSSKELREYFGQVLPDFDRDRVHDSDIKKLFSWYNILVKAGITNFEEVMAPTEGNNVDDRKEQE